MWAHSSGNLGGQQSGAGNALNWAGRVHLGARLHQGLRACLLWQSHLESFTKKGFWPRGCDMQELELCSLIIENS